MAKNDNHIIDMTLEGEFVSPPPLARPPIGARIMVWAIVAMVLARRGWLVKGIRSSSLCPNKVQGTGLRQVRRVFRTDSPA